MPRSRYYWFRTRRMHTGHAALIIDLDTYIAHAHRAYGNPEAPIEHQGMAFEFGDLYVSWMGGGDHRAFKGYRGVTQDIEDDREQYGSWHEKRVTMHGLNTLAMIQEWRAIRNGGHHWRLFDKNCASVVRRVLQRGGAQRYVRHPLVTFGIASPAGLYRYTKDVAKHGPQPPPPTNQV